MFDFSSGVEIEASNNLGQQLQEDVIFGRIAGSDLLLSDQTTPSDPPLIHVVLRRGSI